MKQDFIYIQKLSYLQKKKYNHSKQYYLFIQNKTAIFIFLSKILTSVKSNSSQFLINDKLFWKSKHSCNFRKKVEDAEK